MTIGRKEKTMKVIDVIGDMDKGQTFWIVNPYTQERVQVTKEVAEEFLAKYGVGEDE